MPLKDITVLEKRKHVALVVLVFNFIFSDSFALFSSVGGKESRR